MLTPGKSNPDLDLTHKTIQSLPNAPKAVKNKKLEGRCGKKSGGLTRGTASPFLQTSGGEPTGAPSYPRNGSFLPWQCPQGEDSLHCRPFPISLNTESKRGLILFLAFPSYAGIQDLKSYVGCVYRSQTILSSYFPGKFLVQLLAGQVSGGTTRLVCESCRKAVPSVLKQPGHRVCFGTHETNTALIFDLGRWSSESVGKHSLHPTGPNRVAGLCESDQIALAQLCCGSQCLQTSCCCSNLLLYS